MTQNLTPVDPAEVAELALQPLRAEAERLRGVKREGAEAKFVLGVAEEGFSFIAEVMETHGIVFARRTE